MEEQAAPELGDAVDVAHEYPSELQVGELDRALDVLMLSEGESVSDWQVDITQFITHILAADESNDLDPHPNDKTFMRLWRATKKQFADKLRNAHPEWADMKGGHAELMRKYFEDSNQLKRFQGVQSPVYGA